MIGAVFILSCADPQFAPLKQALLDFERGQEEMAAGQPAQAAESFVRARAGDIQSPVLALWEARARAAAGDVEGAERLATEVLRSQPDAGLASYNRAAWRVRLGRTEGAAEDLARAIAIGFRSPYEAAIDPDFAPVLGTAPFAAVLPPTPVVARATGPDGSVFLGSAVLVSVALLSAPEGVVELWRTGPSPGCVVLDRIVEDQVSKAGVLARRIDLHFRATGACTTELTLEARMTQPVLARVSAGVVRIDVAAPSSFAQAAPDVLAEQFPLPGSLAAEDAAWGAGRVGSLVWAMGRADVAPTFNGAVPPIRLELRVQGSTRAAGGAWPVQGGGEVAAGEWRTRVASE